MSNKNSVKTKVSTSIITFCLVLSDNLLLTFDSSGISAPSSGFDFFIFFALCFSNFNETACACLYNLTNLNKRTSRIILTIFAAPAAALAPNAPYRDDIDSLFRLKLINSLTGMVGLIRIHKYPMSGMTLTTAAKSNQN